jgi:hypothetical protein
MICANKPITRVTQSFLQVVLQSCGKTSGIFLYFIFTKENYPEAKNTAK